MDSCKIHFDIKVIENFDDHTSKIEIEGKEIIVDTTGLNWPCGEYEEIGGDPLIRWIERWEIK